MSEKKLGANIAYQRKKKGLSQEKVAEYMDVSRQAVTKWEGDISRPSTENLIRLAELFGVSVEFLLGSEEPEIIQKETKIMPAKHTWLFVGISFLCALTYIIVSVARGHFSVGTLICLFVVVVPIQLFLHIFFHNAIKNDDFNGIAGYSDDVDYDTEEVKKMLVKIDLHLQVASALYVFLLCTVNCFDVGNGSINGVLIFLYIAEFISIVMINNYNTIDKMLLNEEDRMRAKISFPISVSYIVLLLLGMVILFAVFEMKGIENNTIQAVKTSLLLVFGVGNLTVGFLAENKHVKSKIQLENKYRPRKFSLVCLFVSVAMFAFMCIV